MRDIKFRVWDDDSKEMVEGGVGIDVNGIAYVSNPLNDDFTYYPDCPIMQATGLKDKNGVEIYEGDIIGSRRFTEGIVKYGECGGGGPDEGFKSIGFYVDDNGWDKGLIDIDPIEVIGNIYETPELLK